METKVKVRNTKGNKVCINLKKFNGTEKKIPPKGMVSLTEDELIYVLNSSKAFEVGILALVDGNPFTNIDVPESKNAITDDSVSVLLKKNLKNLEAELSEIDSTDVLQSILAIAKEQDKSIKVIEVIEKRLDSLMRIE